MEKPSTKIRILAVVEVLKHITLCGEENMVRLVGAMKELRDIAESDELSTRDAQNHPETAE